MFLIASIMWADLFLQSIRITKEEALVDYNVSGKVWVLSFTFSSGNALKTVVCARVKLAASASKQCLQLFYIWATVLGYFI